MLVRDDGSIVGTLGGGSVEQGVIELSLAAMSDGSVQTVPFNLTGMNGVPACGGKLLVLIEPILPAPHLVIAGAGHVGKALSVVASFTGFKVTVVDDRSEFASRQAVPNAECVVLNEFTDPFNGVTINRDTYILIATRGHDHDLDALKAALATEACYVGLVGSSHKKALLLASLTDAGFSDADTGRVITPVGLPIGSVTPEEIAISIMAQIVQKRRKNALSGVGSVACGGAIQEDGEAQAAPRSQRPPRSRGLP